MEYLIQKIVLPSRVYVVSIFKTSVHSTLTNGDASVHQEDDDSGAFWEPENTEAILEGSSFILNVLLLISVYSYLTSDTGSECNKRGF